tara:strand:+ start:4512 stop:5099 length:588 start_codon:yes stop_codon:yes gene_type:complete
MNNILITDIFGKTPALIALADAIEVDIIVDPYNGKDMNFKDEVQAYSYFTENVGIDRYLEKLLKTITDYSCECVLIGFSVGASVIWKLNESISVHLAKRVKWAVCYYGSQIRHLTELSPRFEMKLVFPKRETHFNVLALQDILANKEKVTTMQVDFLHGFMNTHSDNFNRVGYNVHLVLLRQELRKDINLNNLPT